MNLATLFSNPTNALRVCDYVGKKLKKGLGGQDTEVSGELAKQCVALIDTAVKSDQNLLHSLHSEISGSPAPDLESIETVLSMKPALKTTEFTLPGGDSGKSQTLEAWIQDLINKDSATADRFRAIKEIVKRA